MHLNKRTVMVLFVAVFAVVAAAKSALAAAYVSAILGLTIVVGLMAYSLFVGVRNWRLDHTPRHRL